MASLTEGSNGLAEEDEFFIDDDEFGIPPVHNLPSLEDILNEAMTQRQDPLAMSEEDEEDASTVLIEPKLLNGSASLFKAQPSYQSNTSTLGSLLDTLSLHSSLSDASKPSRSSRPVSYNNSLNNGLNNLANRHSIMRRVLLKGVSAQLQGASDKDVNAGNPTCLAAQSVVAVGFAHGFVFVFDTFQVLKWSLGGPRLGSVYGPVSSLALTTDSSRLLVGFAKGQVVEFDLNTGKIILEVDDAHPMGNAVTRLRYIEQDQGALLSDAGGSLFELRFKQKLTMGRGYSSRCIFSGSRGEVFSFEPLSTLNQPLKLDSEPILALATISKVIVLVLRPRIKVLFSHPLVGRADSLPLLAWQVVMVQNNEEQQIEKTVRRPFRPLLAFGRHNTLYVYRMLLDEEKERNEALTFEPVHKLVLPYLVLHMAFLTPRCLSLLSENETLHLLDLQLDENNELEMQNLDKLGLVYQSSFFKGLATGNNVSKAMAMAGQKAVYESIAAVNEQLLMLGKQQLQVMIMRNWEQRIEFLVDKANAIQEAILLTQEIYMDPGKALLGLKGSFATKRGLVSNKLRSLVKQYLKTSMTTNFPLEGDVVVLANYFDRVVPPCVSSCLLIEDFDLLFDEVWPTFELDPFAKGKFLECLEQSFITDKLRRPPVPVMQAFVNHFVDLRRFEALEACLTHVDVASLDLHQVMSVSRKHLLTDVIIYINNYGLNNFLTPLQELMAVLRRELKRSESNLIDDEKVLNMGQKLLLYISYCLTGKAYFSHWDNNIDEEALNTAKYEVYNNLISLHLPYHYTGDNKDVYKGDLNENENDDNKEEEKETYPYLRSLLWLDTQCFLNVLLMAFEEEADFNTELGLCRKQRLIDALIQVMVDDEDKLSSSSFSPTQLAQLFTFVAQQLVSDQRMKLSVSKELFQQLLIVLTTFDQQELKRQQRQEREEALLQLLKSGGDEYFDRDRLLQRAEEAQFFQIQSHIYEQDNNCPQCLKCYLLDPIRKHQTFQYLQRVQWSKKELESSLIANLELLVAFDVEQTLEVVTQIEKCSLMSMVEKLSHCGDDELLYCFLKQCYETCVDTEEESRLMSDFEHFVHQPKMIELTIKLMNQKQPENVVHFLQRNMGHWGDTMDARTLLQLCKSQGNLEAQAFLLERSNSLDEALSVLLTHFRLKITTILSGNTQKRSVINSKAEWNELRARLKLVLRFYQRVFIDKREKDKQRETKTKEQVWKRMLNLIAQTDNENRTDRDNTIDKMAWRTLMHEFLVATARSVSAECLIETIFMNESLQKTDLIDMSHFLPFLFDSLRHESSLLLTSRELVQKDRCQRLKLFQRLSRRAVANSRKNKTQWRRGCDIPYCDFCGHDLLSKNSNMVVAFGIHQVYHVGCLVENGGRSIDNLGVVKYTCPNKIGKELVASPSTKSSPSIRTEMAIEKGLASASRQSSWGLKQLEQLRILSKQKTFDDFESNTVFDKANFALKLTPNHSKDSWF